jgi:hypothetical protein
MPPWHRPSGQTRLYWILECWRFLCKGRRFLCEIQNALHLRTHLDEQLGIGPGPLVIGEDVVTFYKGLSLRGELFRAGTLEEPRGRLPRAGADPVYGSPNGQASSQ